jgi:hypothetical protein
MKHFIVMRDWANEDFDKEIEILGVAHTEDEAKKIFKQYVDEERQYALEQDFVIYEDCDTVFDAGVDGEYASKHTILCIRQV